MNADSADRQNTLPGASAALSPAEGSVTLLLEQFRRGDQAAAEGLWAQYFPRLLALARKTVARWPRGAADPDDAVQSAFVAFWRQAEQGQLPPDLHRDRLWSLLALITVRKAQKQLERKRAQKRGGGKVRNEASFPPNGEGGFRLDELIGELPVQEFDLRCEELLMALDEDLRRFAVLRLMGHTTQEIAQQFDCTQRKVQRKLNLIELRWRSVIED
jgi:RNA polymerase sigma factor (sigma-70 family)